MPKVRLPIERAVAAARRLLVEARVAHPDQIDVEELAARSGAMILYGPISTARAMIVRRGGHAVIRIDERLRGRPSAHFPAAHELAHHLLHDLVDHYVQCTTTSDERSDEAWYVEREASDCAAEILIPEALGAPFCAAPRATVEAIDRLARAFSRSFEMSAIRMTELTMAPCAVVVSEGRQVKWALESLTFPGAIRRYGALHPASLAARLPARAGADREREVPGAAWKGAAPFVERAWRTGPQRVVSWIVPA